MALLLQLCGTHILIDCTFELWPSICTLVYCNLITKIKYLKLLKLACASTTAVLSSVSTSCFVT